MPGDPNCKPPSVYVIQVAGRLDPEWTAWFDGMTIYVIQGGPGETITALQGSITDQAALFGLLTRIRDLGLKLVSVNRVISENIKKERV